MQPLGDRVILQLQEEAKEKKVGNLWVQPPKWAKPTDIATVLHVSKNVTEVKVGDKVQFDSYAVKDTEDKLIKIAHEKDILCLILPTNQ